MKKIYTTSDYSLFKLATWNRDIRASRVKKIKDSIKSVGYWTQPILVNEKMEIVDGQGRYLALKELNMPVDYVIEPGAGVKECIAMNINMTNWSLQDYVHSFAMQGITDYQYLEALYKKYNNLYFESIINAIRQQNWSAVQESRWNPTANNESIKDGSFKCSPEEYDNARAILDYVERFYEKVKAVCGKYGGQNKAWYYALEFAYRCPLIDNETLYKKVMAANINIAVANRGQALEALSDIYNNRNRGEKIRLLSEYQYFCDNKKIRE